MKKKLGQFNVPLCRKAYKRANGNQGQQCSFLTKRTKHKNVKMEDHTLHETNKKALKLSN